ncbi:TIGR02466 family protein [Candidatus Pelagibacter sp.]|nr:TIGR02466 family protein [Candidatus Pelagibacter sp.]
MHRDLHFPTPIYIADIDHPTLNQELERDIIAWSNKDKGMTRTNIKGWHSGIHMHELPEYKKLVDMLYACQKTIYDQEHLDSEPFLGNMWANINPPGGMNRAHQHPNSLWSGVYYIKAPKNCGLLKIDDPRSSAAMVRPNLKKGQLPQRLYRETHYEPIAGRCIMFPSWLMHCVDPNGSNDIRISVSFNFLQKGMFV